MDREGRVGPDHDGERNEDRRDAAIREGVHRRGTAVVLHQHANVEANDG
jgi:hypothetical protein